MMIHDCIPCQYGDHDGHMDVPQPAPEGMMGGWECHCKGECRNGPRPEPVSAALCDADYGDIADDLAALLSNVVDRTERDAKGGKSG